MSHFTVYYPSDPFTSAQRSKEVDFRSVPVFGHDLTSCFLSVPRPQVEVIGGADMYHARCRKCYGGLMDVLKENSAPHRDETPPHVMTGKLLDNTTSPRKLFATLQL